MTPFSIDSQIFGDAPSLAVAVPPPAKIAVNVVHIIAARAGVPFIGISFISL